MGNKGAILSRKVRVSLFTLLIAFSSSFVFQFCRTFMKFSGDAVIHLTFAERLAAGRPFQFNVGEVSSGTTSLAWTAFEALLFSVGGVKVVSLIVPPVCLICFLATGWLVYRTALRLGAFPLLAACSAVLYVGMPGSAYNAPLGMENAAFALAAAALGEVTLGHQTVRRSRSKERLYDAATGLLLGFAMLLRPEGGLLVIAMWISIGLDRSRPYRDRLQRLLLISGAASALILPAYWFHHSVTGLWIPGSSIARLSAARRASSTLHIGGPFYFYGASLLRLLAYLPVATVAIYGISLLRRQSPLYQLSALVLGLGLFSLVTGAAHTARYLLWFWALLLPIAAYGVDQLVRRTNARPTFALLLPAGVIFVTGIAAAETMLRARDGAQQGGAERSAIADALAKRGENTDRLLREVCRGACCDGSRARVAVTEVQLRFFLDDRVAVASFDGRTAPSRVSSSDTSLFRPNGCPDIDRVLSHPPVDAVLDNPGNQLPACLGTWLPGEMSRAWGSGSNEVHRQGWGWNSTLAGFVRKCPATTPP